MGKASMSDIVPTDQSRFVQDPELFAELTERQEIPQVKIPFPGLGNIAELELQRVGVIALILGMLQLKFTIAGTKSVIANPGFPFNIIKRVAIKANGVTGIIGCSNTTLRKRREKIFRKAADTLLKAPDVGVLAKEKFSITVPIEVPIAHDMLSILGALLAQNPETTLAIELQFATQAEVFKVEEGGEVKEVEGSLEWETVVFSIGKANVGGKIKTVLPDMSAFHGILDNRHNFAAAGEEKSPLIRTAGQLLCYSLNFRNGAASVIAPSSLEELRLEYGANKRPLVWRGNTLLQQNDNNYDGALEVRGIKYAEMDFEVENPTRDLWIPEALTELNSAWVIPNSVEVTTAAFAEFTQETLYPAV